MRKITDELMAKESKELTSVNYVRRKARSHIEFRGSEDGEREPTAAAGKIMTCKWNFRIRGLIYRASYTPTIVRGKVGASLQETPDRMLIPRHEVAGEGHQRCK
jgi:hypothetical protein